MKTFKKIVVLGPESTGKSTLCKKLAEHYNTLWVPEYARGYLEENKTDYTYDDLLAISKGQIESEERICSQLISEKTNLVCATESLEDNSKKLLVDTDMYVMKVWSEFVFNKCHNWILNRIAERKYDLYLLCDIDLPWIRDELREYPDINTRMKLYCFYKDLMVNQCVPWCPVSGNFEERFKKAVAFIESATTKR